MNINIGCHSFGGIERVGIKIVNSVVLHFGFRCFGMLFWDYIYIYIYIYKI